MSLLHYLSAAWRRYRCRPVKLNPRNVILTGVPRSGSTLICHLLNKLPRTVALHEPFDVSRLRFDRTPTQMCDRIDCFLLDTRRSLEETGKALSKHQSGTVPDNHVTDERDASGRRISEVQLGLVDFGHGHDSETLVVLKHPNAFSAILDALKPRFRVYASVRNPLSVLGSWTTVSMAVSQGHAPAAEPLSEDLRERLAAVDDEETRRLSLVSWYFEQYHAHLPRESVLRYEDLIESGGTSLAPIHPGAANLNERLRSRNASKNYDRNVVERAADGMLRMDGAGWWHYYSREEIERVRDAILA